MSYKGSTASKRSRDAFEHDNSPPSHAPYAFYGTPLPAYDADAHDDGSYVPIWKQEVTDERGRKRLHGAFTGGFSAGYFNTVGSKEGWTPSTFTSSRTNRAKNAAAPHGEPKGQRVEDFMDEEDLAEREEQQKLETLGTFAGLGGGGKESAEAKGMFSDIFRGSGETMGVKLLQRMGWRQGQGVGPKVRRRAEGDKAGEMHLFAPENTKMIGFERKTDRKGVGFGGQGKLEDKQSVAQQGEEDDSGDDARILRTKHSKLLSKPKKSKVSGMGMGVLNDTGSDDEDPYAIGPAISYSKIIGGDKKKRKGGLIATNSNPSASKPSTFIATSFTGKKLAQRSSNTTTISGGFRKCHDGRLPLDGFVLATAALTLQENKYPPPTIPSGWVPSKRKTRFTDTKPDFTSTADAAKSSSLDPKARAGLLGEQPLPGKSVFDFLTPAQRDKLATATGKSNLPQARGEGAPAGFETPTGTRQQRTLWDLIPPLDKGIAMAVLQRGKSGFWPYGEDLAKRERYKYFIELRAGVHSTLPSRPKGLSIDEWSHELREFAQAAEVFRPISGLMASRFASSSSAPRLASDAPDKPAPVVTKAADPAEEAAKMGMFGPMTRSKLAFYPTRLLCKRFNVKAPANVAAGAGEGGDDAEGAWRSDVVSQASLNNMMMHANFGTLKKPSSTTDANEVGIAPEQESRHEAAEVNADMNEALESMRAGEDELKAVFGDDGDE